MSVTVANGNGGEPHVLTKADFQSDQETRWCPGCGDYAVLAAVQQFMPELGIERRGDPRRRGAGSGGRRPRLLRAPAPPESAAREHR